LSPTTTSVPLTDTPEPTSCEDLNGNCFELHYYGESCTLKGPTDIKAGSITLFYFNESEVNANLAVLRHEKDKTYQDMVNYLGEEPSTKHSPKWGRDQGAWRSDSDLILPGEIFTWEGFLAYGIHTLVCVRAEPHNVWIGGWFTVEE
jgi:hypothetical protein